LLKTRLIEKPATNIRTQTAINHGTGYNTRPEMIPPQNGITILRKGISLFSTAGSYETLRIKINKIQIDQGFLLHNPTDILSLTGHGNDHFIFLPADILSLTGHGNAAGYLPVP
jgi:hypothetical protein